MLECLKSNAKSKNIVAELFGNLGINAKVLATQIINFAVLLLILQKFAYKPVVGMLEKRREEVERANKHASEIEARIKNIEDTKEAALAEARKESSELIKKAEVSATQAAEKIVADAKEQTLHAAAAEHRRLEQERDKLREDLRKEIGETVASAIERSVGDVLDKGAKEKLLSQALEKTKQ